MPSTGTPPPEFQRSVIPAYLRPKGLEPAVQAVPEQPLPARDPAPIGPQSRPEQENQQEKQDGSAGQQPPPVANLGGASVVAVQSQENNVPPPRASEAVSSAPSSRPETGDLTDEELVDVSRLKSRDREVRSHEAAHATAGAGYAGAPSFDYVTGPDGVKYAVGGHVAIDVSEVRDDPAATIAKMDVVRRAALAPARPSGQDRAVAAAASAKAQEAQAELAKEAKEQVAETSASSQNGTSNVGDLTAASAGQVSAGPSDNGTSAGFADDADTADNTGGFAFGDIRQEEEPELFSIDFLA